ncbi:MAG TPA: helical backbone metal receptor [Nitrospirota bacterium]
MRTRIIAIVLALSCCRIAFAADFADPPKRIVSLSPSTTEILFAMGLGDRIAGVTNYCDYPQEAKQKPRIGGMSNPSLEAVLSLRPDIVVMTTDGNPKEFEERLVSLRINTYVFEARTIRDLPRGIRKLASALGVEERGEKLAKSIEKGIRKAAPPAAGVAARAAKEKVLFIVWPEPLLVAGPGTAIDDAVRLLGAENIASRASTAYPKYSIEEVIRQAPEVIIIGKGSGMDMVAVSKGLLNRLSSVPAIKNSNVCYVGDGLYRLGPRVAQGIEELAQCLK